jgi:hypothetical protein
LGSGIYRVGDQTVQIYRLSVAIPLIPLDDRKWGLQLRLPLTFSFYNFQFEDILEGVFPERLATLALVPTAEFSLPVYDNWALLPYGAFGGGRDFSGGEFNWIFAAGVRSIAIWPWKGNHLRLGNRLVYTGYTTKGMDFVDDFAMFETGLDVRRPLGFDIRGIDIDGSVFGANYLYFISPNVLRLIPDTVDMRTEWELGVTIGTVDPWRVLGIGMPRLGLSYRFGTGTDAWRIIIGNPFPLDSPRDKGAEVN